MNPEETKGNAPETTEQPETQISRKDFIASGAVLGMTALVGGLSVLLPQQAQAEHLDDLKDGNPKYTHNDPENMIYSVCMNCNTCCPTKVKIQDGVIAKIDGNPYTPWNRVPHLSYKTKVQEAAKIEGALCPKGQSATMTVYDPYRIRKVLKRDGPRGSMQWKTIEFNQAITEIVNGGKLFSNVTGEEGRNVQGLKDIWVLRDAKIAGEMEKGIEEIWKAKTPEDKQKKVAEFKTKFKDHLHLLIDPDHPDLGPKNNQFLWIHGRLKGGRSDFFSRFIKDSFGSANFHGHTTVCQGSLYFTGKAMSEQYGFDEKKRKSDWFGGEKFFWQGDQNSAEFILFVGASPFEANYPPLRTPNITTGLTSGRLKIAVADPRFSKTAAKAWKWLPIKPGEEAALAFAILHWMIQEGKYDKKYLGNANKAAATQDGEPTWSNACWLIKMKDGKPGEFLRASDLKLTVEKRKATIKKKDKTEEVEYEFNPFIVLVNGKPVPFDPNDEKQAVEGELFVDTELAGIKVKTPMKLLEEAAKAKTIAQWAEICGLPAEDIEAVAQELTSHGKKGVVDCHRGVSQHTNGFYNCISFNTVNLLLGNYDWRGGFVKASGYDMSGGKAAGPFDFKTGMNSAKAKPFGVGLLREKKWEDTSLFEGKYPAKRPWFPNATDLYQELLPSVEDGYPYPIKALLLYMGTPGYALPAGQTQIQVLANLEKLPLFIASDVTVGESSMYADYIIPDVSFYERWEFSGSHPNNIWKVGPVRQPVIAPLTETVTVFGEEMPICLESFMLGVAEKMGLPGYGKDGFGKGSNFVRPEDMYLRMVANLAFGEKADGSDAVPEADDAEIAIFTKARRHLPKTVFDLEKWKAAVGEQWKRVVYVLNRGGRFQEYEKAFDGEKVKGKYGKQINMYCEKVAKSKNSMTGKSFYGMAAYLPLADCMGQPLVAKPDDLRLITYREIFHTKSRTASNPWLMELAPENFVLISTTDAQTLGLESGASVKIVSDSNPEGVWELPNFGTKPMVGKVKVTQGIRPGVIAFSLGHGHWAYGSADIVIDGKKIPGDPKRGAGIHANAAMMIDPHLKNVSLQDLVGGSVSFYDSPVRLVKV